ncbi:uncharacterized protein LOC18099018 isoform X2 [Populus trichocarpa]|uniref:uncharacterized protein LOC18099018 isoform X2 n=1 Tax=Populus trichocarpa TaxID=3694 RepID=UPI000D188E59|nr:uncharacterized protein LOC18099018 isoform X2 [Populus trichocarpa]|eukprot:XP_024456125.1 uncharacterized protein LOC18099018 isoform X2 [Populus trichocarpa]
MMEGDAAMVRIQRKSSMESEPRTLTMDQIQFAREAALYVVNTRSIEEALSIFTEVNNLLRFRARGRTKWRQNEGYEQRNAVCG